MRPYLLTTLLMTGFLATEALARDLRWTLYEDNEFGCVLDYPASLFSPEASNPDQPRRFSSENSDAYFRIQGVENANGWSPRAIREKYLSADMPGDVTYDRTKSDFVVLSGYRGESIFYTKVAVSTDRSSACIFEITYPRVQKKAFDKIVTRMSRSLRSLN